MHYQYRPSGVCSSHIDFDLEDGLIKNVVFTGGCNGNLKAISILIEGMSASEVMGMLQGNQCGFRTTSCADQLSKAIEGALEKSATG